MLLSRSLRARDIFALLLVFAGCATEANTLEPLDEDASGGGGAASGGAAPSGGKPTSSAGKSAGGTGQVVNAFGGAQSSGGKPTTTAGAAGGGSDSGGNGGSPTAGSGSGGAAGAGTGGSATSGASGSSATGGGGAGAGGSTQGGSSGAAGSAGSGSANCLDDWQGDQACDTCSSQTQSDKLACIDILNCFIANSCGPATCAGNDDKCGANKIGKGTAGFPIASQVYSCMCQ